MQKTYTEMAVDIVTAMINKGYLRVPADKGEDWKSVNKKTVRTVGWATMELYCELKEMGQKAKDELADRELARVKKNGQKDGQKKIIVTR